MSINLASQLGASVHLKSLSYVGYPRHENWKLRIILYIR